MTSSEMREQLRAGKKVDGWRLHENGGGLVQETATVERTARVYGNARVCGDAQVYGNAQVYGDAQVYGAARVCGDARVYGNARVCGDAQVYGNAQVASSLDLIHVVFGAYSATAYRDKKGVAWLSYGCELHELKKWPKLHAKLAKQHVPDDAATYEKITREVARLVTALLPKAKEG